MWYRAVDSGGSRRRFRGAEILPKLEILCYVEMGPGFKRWDLHGLQKKVIRVPGLGIWPGVEVKRLGSTDARFLSYQAPAGHFHTNKQVESMEP